MEADRKFWETCCSRFSHVEIAGHLHSESALEKSWKEDFVESIDWRDKKVIDYGIGKGLLGTLLHRDYGIREYIGVDIAERSIAAARSAHRGMNSSFMTVKDFYGHVPTADILVSQACIQHFPSVAYLTSFLHAVTKTGASIIMLQVARGPTGEADRAAALARGHLVQADVVRGLYTEKGFLLRNLAGYACTRERNGSGQDYVFYTFEKVATPTGATSAS